MNKIVKAEILPYSPDQWTVVMEIEFAPENGGGTLTISKVKEGSLRNAALFLGEWVQSPSLVEMKRPEWLEDE